MNEFIKPALLIFIDGTICDDRHRLALYSTDAFNAPQNLLGDRPVAGSADALAHLSTRYEIVYIGARSPELVTLTSVWLGKHGFPKGEILLGEEYAARLDVCMASAKRHAFAAGIGDRYDDSALHQELGIRSIIIEEYEGDWKSVVCWLGGGTQ